MNHLIKKLSTLFFALVLVAATSCTYVFPEPEALVPGSADFTKLVSVGNSLTAGYMNGALYDDGQAASFPNIMAQQMKSNGGGEFNQPDIASPLGYFGSAMGIPGVPDGTPLGRLHLVNPLDPRPQPFIPGDPFNTSYSGDKSKLNNFGVPGMRIIHAEVPGYGDPVAGNPFYARFASSGTSTVLGDATAANGTFFTFWLGNNDVLGYALAGATGAQNGTTGIDMTPIDLFTGAYNSAIAAMTANDAFGIVANIPNVQDIAHFTTVPWNAIPMDQAQADAANGGYLAFNGGINAYNAGLLPGLDPNNPPAIKRDVIAFAAGQNGIVIVDVTIPDLSAYGIPPIRQATSSDLITLTAGAVLGTLADPLNPASVIGVGVPLDEKYTLILADQEAIADRTAAYNAVIKAAADATNNKIAFLDMNSIFANLVQTGVSINGSGMDATLAPPFGAFSLDGVHPNARGAAYIASLFIDKINETFSSNIPNVNPNNYAGNELPVP
jgi:lysophospholipase L1-like esterase